MGVKEIISKVTEDIEKAFFYAVCIFIGLGLIWGFIITPIVMLTEKLG